MNKQINKHVIKIDEQVTTLAASFEAVALGCEAIANQVGETPLLVAAYAPLLPVLKRLQLSLERAIVALEQPPAGREGREG